MKQVCIIGGGTAGMAAAYALKDRSDISLIVVERESTLGGTAVNGWVNTWIEGLNPPYLQDIFKELSNEGKASGDLDASWLADRLRKDQKNSSPLIFDVQALADKYESDLLRVGVKIYTGYEFESSVFINAKPDNHEVKSVIIKNLDNGEEKTIEADFFIDSSGDGILCRSVNSVENEDFYCGEDPKIRFNEADAPECPRKENLNKPSLLYKIELDNREETVTSILSNDQNYKKDYITGDGYNMSGYEYNDRPEDIVNPLTGQGLNAIDALKNYSKAYIEARKRCAEHWNYVRSELKAYVDASPKPDPRSCMGFPPGLYVYNYNNQCAPMLGIREGFRIRCEYMLKQKDLTEKIDSGDLKHFIACGGHTVDFQGIERRVDFSEFNKQVVVSGIPYECIIPKKLTNVLIACRAFGVSHIALSARRINKDMSQLGWAAGHAIGICIEKEYANTRDVIKNISELQQVTKFKSGVEFIEPLMK